MTYEIDIKIKDCIDLNVLSEVLKKELSLSFQISNSKVVDYKSQIHSEVKRNNVLNLYNLYEDVDNGTLRIRPVGAGCGLKVVPANSNSIPGKTIRIISNETKNLVKEFEFSKDVSSIEFIPIGKIGYTLRISYGISDSFQTESEESDEGSRLESNYGQDVKTEIKPIKASSDDKPAWEADDRFSMPFSSTRPEKDDTGDYCEKYSLAKEEAIKPEQAEPLDITDKKQPEECGILSPAASETEEIEKEISIIEEQKKQLELKKQREIAHLKKIEDEYKKDYYSFEQELDEMKSRMEADRSILEYYKDCDVTSIETVFEVIDQKLEEAERQLRFFIEAKQKRTMEIENAIK